MIRKIQLTTWRDPIYVRKSIPVTQIGTAAFPVYRLPGACGTAFFLLIQKYSDCGTKCFTVCIKRRLSRAYIEAKKLIHIDC